ncbi:hypothetical protein PROFUN_12187 [Planoprotostelium fungivorum]|uniref:SigF-like NTF2-like domain-containing protein n=1 Tax=Planoprotostelium fungivorum TaxID=1890364 RepID=A0A2P6N8H3_9EUKA|nr:hypothetical protein PROFUN_12187 [Planoprotostelium fungivorum]
MSTRSTTSAEPRTKDVQTKHRQRRIMNNPPAEVEDVIRKLTLGSKEDLLNVVNTYFTQDASFDHPLAWVQSSPKHSRESVLNIYRAYHVLSEISKIEINSIDWNPENLHLVVDLFETLSFPLQWPRGPMKLRLVVVLKFRKVDDKYYIKSQEDLFPIQDLLHLVPFGKFIISTVKTVASFNGQIIGAVAHRLGYW